MSTSVISEHLFYRWSSLIGSWEFTEIELQPFWRCVWQQRGCQGLTNPKGEWLPAADQKKRAGEHMPRATRHSCRQCGSAPAEVAVELCVLLALFLLRIPECKEGWRVCDDFTLLIFWVGEVGSRLIQSFLLNGNYKNKYSISQHSVAQYYSVICISWENHLIAPCLSFPFCQMRKANKW